MARRPRGAKDWLDRLRRARPLLFAHWLLCYGNGRTSGAVMNQEVHVRFWERLGMRFPRATRLDRLRRKQPSLQDASQSTRISAEVFHGTLGRLSLLSHLLGVIEISADPLAVFLYWVRSMIVRKAIRKRAHQSRNLSNTAWSGCDPEQSPDPVLTPQEQRANMRPCLSTMSATPFSSRSAWA